ncbi:restriction endonuclease subunit S [Lawsonibacter sp. LCP25S3_G6]|uniref:restriction endonuclease subunit S n=1 Tax=unclassified Lawsonibacter TaxID=2617946 RepID=UPI003F94B79F
MARLGDIGQIITGNTPKTADVENYASKDIAFIKPSDIQEDKLTMLSEAEFYISEYARERARILSPKCILVTCIGIVGKVAINNIECAFNQQINAIIPDTKRCDTKYVAYAIQSQQHRLQNIANAAVVPILNKTQFSDIEISLPPLEEQRRIAATLDKVSDLIAKRRAQLDKLDLLVKARFVEMFGDPVSNPKEWPIVGIKEIIGGKVSNGFFAKRDDYIDEGNVQVLGVANVVNRMYSNIDDLPKTNATSEDREKYGVKYGDMLFCRSSLVAEGIGKASIVPPNTPNNVLFECHVIRVPLNLKKCIPEFIQVLSTTNFFRQQIIAQSKTATMTTIGQDGILKSQIILPPLEQQQKFLRFLKQTNESKLTIQQSLDKLEILEKALMQKYFG